MLYVIQGTPLTVMLFIHGPASFIPMPRKSCVTVAGSSPGTHATGMRYGPGGSVGGPGGSWSAGVMQNATLRRHGPRNMLVTRTVASGSVADWPARRVGVSSPFTVMTAPSLRMAAVV